MARFAIGIDLGTSNCALEWSPLQGAEASVSTFNIRQYETPERVVESAVLPSFLYLKEHHSTADLPYVAGLMAREQFKSEPSRCIHSAKSWLCHPGVDRELPILPWHSVDVPAVQQMSPVAASAAYLSYLKEAWDQQFAAESPEHAFAQQQITVTVPASFDQVAQRLTLKAAQAAGYPQSTRLLEEPQAAFLAWISEPGNQQVLRALQQDKSAQKLTWLVCDVGGGTTDFSLFSVQPSTAGEDPVIERMAVSDHILLGGDNIDLALAKRAEAEFLAIGYHVRPDQWLQLVAQARMAKEAAFSGDAQESTLRITLLDSGSSLFAATQTLQWSLDATKQWVVERFFPECAAHARAATSAAGFVEMGLPYAQEPAITVHLAEFLAGRSVDGILFNGGSVCAAEIQQRIGDLVSRWQSSYGAPRLFAGDNPYLAVARGAAHYGRRLKQRADTMIKAGAARPLLVEVQANLRSAERHLLCVLPKGATPADQFVIKKPTFALRLNRPVQFQPFTGPDTDRIRQGQIVKWRPADFHAMPPLQTLALTGDSIDLEATGATAEVILRSQLNELGLVELQCVATEQHKGRARQQWDLAFDLRQVLGAENQLVTDPEESMHSTHQSEVFTEVLGGFFTERVLKELEEQTGEKRGQWALPLLRKGFDTLIGQVSRRSHTEAYETAWWMAAGYCLRPGCGAPLDEFRVRQLEVLLDLGLCHPSSKAVREQCAVFWRRVARGLSAELQDRLFDENAAVAFSGSKRGLEPLKLLAALEGVSLERKRKLLDYLCAALPQAPRWAIESYLWCAGRVCARIPLSRRQEWVVPPVLAEALLEVVFKLAGAPVPHKLLLNFILQSARISGADELDFGSQARERIHRRALELGFSADELAPLKQYKPLAREELQSQYGEALPQGLVLV
jgi:molecular chaperone DnaK (HSP70)